MIYPRPLKKGDKIALIAPATTVKREYVEGAARLLELEGYVPEVMPHTLGPADGSYASSAACRLADFRAAWRDPQIRAILCARGGYGAVHLLDGITDSELLADPKWLIGFSDISALHGRLHAAGIASIHGPMAKHLTEEGRDDICTDALLRLLSDTVPTMDYTIPPHPFNRCGQGRGELRGGNLAVLSHLTGTPYDLLSPRTDESAILFIEDISEAIYATERMLWQLKLSGVLARCAGLLVGSFTESRADRNFPDTATMIHTRLDQWGLKGFPVAFGVPTGHTARNLPLVEGARVTLEVTGDGVRLFTENQEYI